MLDDRTSVVTRVFAEVLEQMAFMFGETSSPEAFGQHSGTVLIARMTYRGNLHGMLQLAVPEEMCPELAANFMGTEPEEVAEPRIYTDALKELLNVTCGNVLTALAGDEPIFDLTVPEVSEMTSAEKERMLEDESTAFLVVDDYPVAIRLSVEDYA